ncbi:DUF397 domain-containing protein [Spirillospora sp. NPDC048911]|uniref:DUF397 domain-containing protein n=1 Tax=Spirillospora sp. NPDC048911 TaxID=3364527 RepID=UPI003722A34D
MKDAVADTELSAEPKRVELSPTSRLTRWQRSQACQASNGCLELAGFTTGVAGARDSVLGDESPALTFGQDEMRALFTRIKAGELDLG